MMHSHKEYFLNVKKIFKSLNYSSSDAENIFMHVLNISLEDLILNDLFITEDQKNDIASLVQRRIHGEPVAYLTGKKAFHEYEFKVTSDTLIPRNETEILVNAVIQEIKKQNKKHIKVLDLCTGSGCIILSILKTLQREGYDISGVGVDISEKAIEIAKENAKQLQIDAVNFICCDIKDFHWNSHFDVIVSNPPYVPSNDIQNLEISVKNYEPHNALDGGSDGLKFYRDILKIINTQELQEFFLAFEVGIGQYREILQMLQNYDTTTFDDFLQIERVIIAKKAKILI